jgi:osmotically-inducible protein OsmY
MIHFIKSKITTVSVRVLLMSMPLMQACSVLGLAMGAAATTGIAASQEGGLSAAVSDGVIKAKINDAWLNYDVNTFTKLSTTVEQARVLITGVVQDPEARVEAVRLAWQVKGVQQVINEIRVAENEGITGFIKDTWITSRLRTAITIDRGVQSINYSIDTVSGVIYLMGYAQNRVELNRVVETARTISGVKQVVSYVKMVGEDIKSDPLAEENNAYGDDVRQ